MRLPNGGSQNQLRSKNSLFDRSELKTIFICFYHSKASVHYELTPPGKNFTLSYLRSVQRRLCPIYVPYCRCIVSNGGFVCSTTLYTLIEQRSLPIFAISRILSVNHSFHLHDLGKWDFNKFGKLRFEMKHVLYAGIQGLEKVFTDIL